MQSQREYFTDYIQRHPDWFFAGMYTDDGVSGLSVRNRDGFNRMVADALGGKIDMIITKSLSRFARNTVDALTKQPQSENRRGGGLLPKRKHSILLMSVSAKYESKPPGKAGGFDCGILFFKRAQQVLACKENRRKIRYDVCYAREDA